MEGRKRVGILTGGGDCPGLNAAIRATAKTALKMDYEVIGIRNGWRGFVDNDITRLNRKNTSGIIDRGGTILGTSRWSPFQVDGGPQQILDEFEKLGLEALVVLGGEGTLSCAGRLFKMGLPVVGIPKTIDNDVLGTDYTIGFQTAVQIATEALDRLRSTAESHHRVMLLEVMGRNAGWIATYAGMANGADAILIPEIPLNKTKLEELCKMLKERSRRGSAFSVLVVAEGTELEGKTIGRNGFDVSKGQKRYELGGIGNVLGEIIENRTGLETKVSSLGYIQRGGTPVAYDRSLATAFGVKAAELIREKKYGLLVALKGNVIASVPLEEVAGGIKKVYMNAYRTAEIFFG